MRASAQKISTAAVSTALAVIMCAATAYLPLSIMPLYFAAFCIFIACKRASVVYGILSAVATVGIMFAMTGLSVKWFFMLFMFAPYGIITSFIHRFNYFKLKSGIIRGLSAAAFFNLTFACVYLVAINVATVGLDIPVTEYVNALGGYAVLAVIATVALVPLDFIFSTLSGVALKKIPAPVARRKLDPSEKIEPVKPDAAPQKDIFGYDILTERDGKEDGSSDEADKNNDKTDGDENVG